MIQPRARSREDAAVDTAAGDAAGPAAQAGASAASAHGGDERSSAAVNAGLSAQALLAARAEPALAAVERLAGAATGSAAAAGESAGSTAARQGAAHDAGTIDEEGGDARATRTRPARAAEAAERGAADRASPRGEDASIAALRNELTAMRSMLCRQLAQLSWADRRMLEPERALLATRIAKLGLDPDLAEALVAEIEDPGHARAWREVMYGLARRLDVPKEDPLESG